MTSFEFLTVALSFVLGLAVTVLLSSLLAVFRARRTTRMHWQPLTWAGYILVIQFDTWWELFGLVTLERWTVGAFILLLLITLLLFAAGGLVLPATRDEYPEDLGEYFKEDGRWAVVLLAGFTVTGCIANVALFGVPLLGAMNVHNFGALIILVVAVGARSAKVQGTATVLYGVSLATYLWRFVPGSY